MTVKVKLKNKDLAVKVIKRSRSCHKYVPSNMFGYNVNLSKCQSNPEINGKLYLTITKMH